MSVLPRCAACCAGQERLGQGRIPEKTGSEARDSAEHFLPDFLPRGNCDPGAIAGAASSFGDVSARGVRVPCRGARCRGPPSGAPKRERAPAVAPLPGPGQSGESMVGRTAGQKAGAMDSGGRLTMTLLHGRMTRCLTGFLAIVGLLLAPLAAMTAAHTPAAACVKCDGCRCVDVVGDGAYLCNIKKEKSEFHCGFLRKWFGKCEGSSTECTCTTEEPCRADRKLTPKIRG